MGQSMVDVKQTVDVRASDKAADVQRLKEKVGVHPALSEQASAEAKAKQERDAKGQFKSAEDKAKAEAAAKATADAAAKAEADKKAAADKKEPTEQERNFAALRSEVQKAQEKAKALEEQIAALKNAKPAETAKPPVDPFAEAEKRILERVRPEDKGYWEKVVLPSMKDIIAPVREENEALKQILKSATDAAAKQNSLAQTYTEWTAKHNLSDQQKNEVIEAIRENGLEDVWNAKPEAALNAARGILLAQGKWQSGPTPEQKKAAEEAAKKVEEAEELARAKAGGGAPGGGGAAEAEEGSVDWNGLIKAARDRGDRTEERRLMNAATIAAAGVSRDWLAGRRTILSAKDKE